MQRYDEQVLSKIKEILNQLLSQETIGDDENIYEAGVTSIMVLPLLSEIEDKFGVTIPDTEFLDAKTPRALAQVVQKLRGN
ncbi:MAG: acyl carrier protein [Candidatus Acidiferrum sp.]